MNIIQECYLICVLYSFVTVLGINPFQFHVENFEKDNSFAEHVYIRGKHFLKNNNEEDEKSEGRKADNKTSTTSSSIDRTPHSWFSQCIDHFNSSCSGESIPRWNQRYWINSDFHKPGGPIFFMFGGEGSAEGYVDAGKWLDFAEDFGALAVCLEHRFYGQSFIPSLDSSFESMSLLTSQQALADAAMFIQWLKYNYSGAGNLENAKVVTFGGSYPGNLAAWMRQNYPNIVHLAVASSAPVEAKLEFPEFLRTVSEVIYQQDRACFGKIYGAFRCMDNLMNGLQCNETEAWSEYASRHELLDGLHQCRPYNFSVNYERQQFFHNLGARWGSNFPGHRSTSKCHTLRLQNNLDVIEDYGNFLVQTGQTQETCQRSEKDLSAALRTPHSEKREFNETPEDEIVEFVKTLSGRDGKSWTWQTCHEFGYFQVADPEIQLFSDEWDSLIDIRRCQNIFPDANFTRKSIQSRIDFTNAFYKGKKFEGSCTIFVNGQWDPWHSLGFNQQNETSSRNTVISIPRKK